MAFSLSNLNAAELNSVSAGLTAENIGNNAELEFQWAMKAMEHANVHYNLITSVDAARLKLTKLDDEIYTTFREKFPDFVVDVVTEESLKAPKAKEEWRNFCDGFKGRVEDFNQGTLLRLNCKEGYEPDNTIFSVRVQFLAIEIARNREGFNSGLVGKKEETKS